MVEILWYAGDTACSSWSAHQPPSCTSYSRRLCSWLPYASRLEASKDCCPCFIGKPVAGCCRLPFSAILAATGTALPHCPCIWAACLQAAASPKLTVENKVILEFLNVSYPCRLLSPGLSWTSPRPAACDSFVDGLNWKPCLHGQHRCRAASPSSLPFTRGINAVAQRKKTQSCFLVTSWPCLIGRLLVGSLAKKSR